MTQPTRPDAAREAFSDRVMAAIAAMTPPSPTRSFEAAIRTGSARDAMAALVVAWHLATQRDWPVPARLRARSLALVLAVATLLATCSLMAASAARIFVPRVDRTEILEPRGSIIREPAPARIPTGSNGPPGATVIAAPGVVSVEVPKKEPPSTGGQAAPALKKGHVGRDGSTAAHGSDSDQRDDKTAADHSDEDDQADDGDHAADAGTSHDAPDGEGTGGGDGHDGRDDHQTDADGGRPGD